MNRIRPLSAHLTNMIAAGEVVERPAGVVKELVENALDAQAKHVEVEIVAGGMDLIRVKDDGTGMNYTDILQAFARHSTSKIADEADLWAINSLGFRGEALPSIAAVSEVLCQSTHEHNSSRVRIAYGELVEHSRIAYEQGTMVEVKGLFLLLRIITDK